MLTGIMKNILLGSIGLVAALSLRCASVQTKADAEDALSSDDQMVCDEEPTTGSHIREQTCRVDHPIRRIREVRSDARRQWLPD